MLIRLIYLQPARAIELLTQYIHKNISHSCVSIKIENTRATFNFFSQFDFNISTIMTAREKEFDAFLDCEILGDGFFAEIVENKLKIPRDKFRLGLVLVRSAAGNNENYNALMYRFRIKVKLLENEENINVDVIVKALLKTDYSAAFSYFDREKLLYESVLSSFEQLWLERANEVVEFGPQSYKFETAPYELIAMEDLKASHYQMHDRKVGCSLPQARVLLSKLAKFHAASAVRYCKVICLIS